MSRRGHAVGYREGEYEEHKKRDDEAWARRRAAEASAVLPGTVATKQFVINAIDATVKGIADAVGEEMGPRFEGIDTDIKSMRETIVALKMRIEVLESK